MILKREIKQIKLFKCFGQRLCIVIAVFWQGVGDVNNTAIKASSSMLEGAHRCLHVNLFTGCCLNW